MWVSPNHVSTQAADSDEIPLRLHLPPTVGQLVEVLWSDIFADGFETGSTGNWSSTVP